MSREQRILTAGGFELRAATQGAGACVAGHAALFNVEADIGGHFIERIEPGAFTAALESSDIHALFNHSYEHVLGRKLSKTLRVKEDSKGLHFEVDLPDTTAAQDLAISIERGDITQASVQFTMRGGVEEWNTSGEVDVRTIKQVGELFDVSICPRAAYAETEVGLRAMAEAGLKSREHFIKSQNFSGAARRLKMKANLDLRGRE